MYIIPAIDIIDGKCVRLTQGDYSRKKVYAEDPVEVARLFQDHGIRRLHLVDLDGARSNHIVNLRVLEKITAATDLIVDFGGGVKSDEDIEHAFLAGAAMVTGGSIAVKDPATFGRWLGRYGPEKIILGADVRNRKIAIGGWMETSEQDVSSLISFYRQQSLQYAICTDVERDGVLKGPAFGLYRELLLEFPGIKLIASGGVGSVGDIERLAETGVFGAIIGKALYEEKIQLSDLKRFID